jgi:hypothetical protein
LETRHKREHLFSYGISKYFPPALSRIYSAPTSPMQRLKDCPIYSANTTFAAATILDQCPLTDVKSAFRHRFLSIVLGKVNEGQDGIGLDVFKHMNPLGVERRV